MMDVHFIERESPITPAALINRPKRLLVGNGSVLSKTPARLIGQQNQSSPAVCTRHEVPQGFSCRFLDITLMLQESRKHKAVLL
jgi:hypothetical protein